MDFSPWDIADSFRLHEAACLIVGVMPSSKRVPDADEIPAAAKPVLKKLYMGYYFGTMLDASEAIDSPQNPKEKWLFGIAADPSDVHLVWKHPRGAIRKGGTTLDMDATILSYLKHAMVSRSELHRWLTAMGIKSAYSFAPEAIPALPMVAAMSRKPRTNLLSPLILKAQKECTDPSDGDAVFLILRKWASDKVQPFFGISETGLQWTDANDNSKELTLKALKNRLSRQ